MRLGIFFVDFVVCSSFLTFYFGFTVWRGLSSCILGLGLFYELCFLSLPLSGFCSFFSLVFFVFVCFVFVYLWYVCW